MSASLRWLFDHVPPAGTATEVLPGVHWLRMPLPFALDHINLWLIEEAGGWTLVDTGIGLHPTRALWRELFQTVLAGRPIQRIVVTHFHPDHLGQAAWIAGRFQAPVLMTRGEHELATTVHHQSDHDAAELFGEFFRRHGLDAERVSQVRSRGNRYRAVVPELPQSYRPIAENDALCIGGNKWQVLVGRGHSPEHAMLYCAAIDALISGDQLLPKISPNISASPAEPDGDPLAQYLVSLDAMRSLPADITVLPSHGPVFLGAHQRISALQVHHRERLEALVDACREPRTAAELLPLLFRRELSVHELFFAMGEVIAHLNHLRRAGRLVCKPQVDGIVAFHADPGRS